MTYSSMIADNRLINPDLNLSTILNLLLREKKIKPTELARHTKLPQPTVQRIVSGTTTHPHVTSLEPIAKYFSISVNQLLGLEPIPWLFNKEYLSTQVRRVPLISWGNVTSWLDKDHTDTQENTIISDGVVGKKTFALTVNDSSMEPVFSIGTKIIIDPEKTPKDRNFVIVKINDVNEVLLRQLIVDGADYFVKPLSKELMHSKLRKLSEPGNRLCGVLVQTRRDYE